MNMNRSRRRLLHALALAGLLPAAAQARKAEIYRTATWEELVPKGWNPFQQFRDRNLGLVREGSAEERSMMKELREVWDNAPTRADLNGTQLRLPGYVVPLDPEEGGVKEFLLVPYFGACVHSPPPPANQIVHVVLPVARPLRTMDAVWASGTLRTQRQDSPWGISGYSMDGHRVEPYADKR